MRILWRFMQYGLHYRRLVTLEALIATATVVAALVIPRILGTAIDETLTGGLRSEHLQLGAIIVALSVVKGAGGYFEAYVLSLISEKATEDVRNDIFRKLLGLSFGYYDRQRTGDLMSRATSDVEKISFHIVGAPLRLFTGTIMLVGVAYFVVTTDWRLASVTVLFGATYAWRAFQGRGGLKETYAALQARTGKMAAVVQESIAGMRVVKAFGAGDHEERKFTAEASAVAEHQYTANRFWETRGSAFMLIAAVTTGAVMWPRRPRGCGRPPDTGRADGIPALHGPAGGADTENGVSGPGSHGDACFG